MLQYFLRTKIELDEFYNTDSVQSEAVRLIFNNMNNYYHKETRIINEKSRKLSAIKFLSVYFLYLLGISPF